MAALAGAADLLVERFAVGVGFSWGDVGGLGFPVFVFGVCGCFGFGDFGFLHVEGWVEGSTRCICSYGGGEDGTRRVELMVFESRLVLGLVLMVPLRFCFIF